MTEGVYDGSMAYVMASIIMPAVGVTDTLHLPSFGSLVEGFMMYLFKNEERMKLVDRSERAALK